MTFGEITSRVRISEVYVALGGQPPKRGRARAFWRGGDGQNVVLNDKKGVWFDFRDNQGGGILHLIQRILNCDRKAALKWLSEYSGIPLAQDPPWTEAERREWARRRAAAEREVGQFLAWKRELVDTLRTWRNRIWKLDTRACRWALQHVHEDHPDFELVYIVAQFLVPFAYELSGGIERIERASNAELMVVFREQQPRREAA